MQTFTKGAVALGITLALVACGSANAERQASRQTQQTTYTDATYGWGEGRIVGSGNMVSEQRAIAAFDRLVVDGPIDVIVRQGATRSLLIRAEDNLIDLVETTTQDGSLILATRGNFTTRRGITAELIAPDLAEVDTNASGDVRFTDWQADTILLMIGGSGDIDLAGRVAQVLTRTNGSGDIDLRDAQTRSVDVEIDGSGSVLLGAADRLDVQVNGSGRVTAGRLGRLTATINGSGDVRYEDVATDPLVEVNGSGAVRKR